MEILAFYLPQYHPTPHNNVWWGEGFTEWTNVAKAKPLYPGHYQPKVPADLGFYDLRMPEVRGKQVELAREAGVTGFCYYHYWFGNGKEELERPFDEVVSSGHPDFPFCLCWANETWSRKFWNKDGNVGEKVDLIKQEYPGEKDDIAHFNKLIDAFKDKRYIKIDGKPVFMIYRPLAFEGVERFIKLWNKLALENGLKGFFFIGYTLQADNEYELIKDKGFDAVCSCRLGNVKKFDIAWYIRRIISVIIKIPIVISYKKVIPTLIRDIEKSKEDVYPVMIPNWDHTARSGSNGYLYSNSSPELFEEHAKQVLEALKGKKSQICFLKSWNEWGEGNYMEPDLKFGRGYIKALRNAIKTVKGE